MVEPISPLEVTIVSVNEQVLRSIAHALSVNDDPGIWHRGLTDVLATATLEHALWRPQPGMHCIWDQVNHIIVWRRELARTLAGQPRNERLVQEDESWPPVPSDADEAGWRSILLDLEQSLAELRSAVDDLAADPDRPLPGLQRPELTLHGCLAHDSYHCGQVLTLLRLQGTWTQAGQTQ